MNLPDFARTYQAEHLNDTDQQTLAEIKAVLESDIKPLAMLAVGCCFDNAPPFGGEQGR